MLEKKGKYYTELSNTVTTFNENNDGTLSSVNIREAIMKVMMEYGEESIMDSNNVPADTFSYALGGRLL